MVENVDEKKRKEKKKNNTNLLACHNACEMRHFIKYYVNIVDAFMCYKCMELYVGMCHAPSGVSKQFEII